MFHWLNYITIRRNLLYEEGFGFVVVSKSINLFRGPHKGYYTINIDWEEYYKQLLALVIKKKYINVIYL